MPLPVGVGEVKLVGSNSILLLLQCTAHTRATWCAAVASAWVLRRGDVSRAGKCVFNSGIKVACGWV